MSNHFSMGAINKITNKYEYPKIANKCNKYMLKLTQENITYIQSLGDKEKMEIIVEYDKVTQTLVQSLYSHM
jgi:hypothetical protein